MRGVGDYSEAAVAAGIKGVPSLRGKPNMDAGAFTTGIYLDGAWSEAHVNRLINYGFSDVRRAR